MLVGRTGLSPVMVGRAVELDRLAALVGARREPSVALVSGEAGIGKTRLVQELVRRVPTEALVLAGQADPGTTGRPLELLLDAADAALAAAPGQPPDELSAAVRDADRPAEERVRAGVELVRTLARTAAGGTVVVFEDLHWADSESITAFERLAEPDREAGASPGLVLVGTYRPDGLTRRHPAADTLPRLDRRHTVTHIHLGRLSPADVSVFLTAVSGDAPSYRAVDALHTRTGGNPFFLEQLVSSAGALPAADGGGPLPWSVSEVVRSELDALAPDVRAMVSAAAVLGRRVSFDLLAAVTGAAELDLIDRLRAAVESGLLVEGDPDVFGFRHEIAREAVESSLLGRERRRLHEAALAALRDAGSRDHIALARHARGAGRYDDMIEQARIGAHEALALASSFQALQLAEMALDEAPDDLDLLGVATRAAWLCAALDDAPAHAAAYLAAARGADDPVAEAAALAFQVRIAYELGDLEEMVARTDALVDIVDRLPSDEARAEAMAAVAQSYMLREQAEDTYAWADKALDLAEAGGYDGVRLAAMTEKGSMLIQEPDREVESRELLEAVVEEAEQAHEHLVAARALNNLVWHARRWSDIDEVRELIERMRVQAEKAGFDALGVHEAATWLAHLAAVEGDLAGAIRHLDAGLTAHAPRSARAKRAWTSVFRAGLAIEADDLATASELTERLRPPSDRTRVAVIGLDVNIALRSGDRDTARALLPELERAMDTEGYASPSQVHDLVAAALHAGLAPDELTGLVGRLGQYVGHRLDADSTWRRLIEAQLAEARGDVEEAAAGYGAAAAEMRTAPDMIAGHWGTAHVGAAATLLRAGREAEARTHAEAARRHLARWGGWRLEQLVAVERRLGLGDEPDGPDALTPREREVVALLVEGLTNAGIAERLYISPRTAAVHVSNVLAKTGMRSRAEVAAWAVRSGAVEV